TSAWQDAISLVRPAGTTRAMDAIYTEIGVRKGTSNVDEQSGEHSGAATAQSSACGCATRHYWVFLHVFCSGNCRLSWIRHRPAKCQWSTSPPGGELHRALKRYAHCTLVCSQRRYTPLLPRGIRSNEDVERALQSFPRDS